MKDNEKAPPDYTTIDNPYGHGMSRQSPSASRQAINPSPVFPTNANQAVRNGDYLRDLVIKTFIQSQSYVLNKRGFKIDGLTGHAQFNDLLITGGVIQSTNYVSGVSGFLIDGTTGVAQFSDITLTAGTVNFGKTSFTDAAHDGYYISSDGVYFGSAGDASFLKYEIATGEFIVSTIKTAVSGERIEISPGGNNEIDIYDSDDNLVLIFGGTSGQANILGSAPASATFPLLFLQSASDSTFVSVFDSLSPTNTVAASLDRTAGLGPASASWIASTISPSAPTYIRQDTIVSSRFARMQTLHVPSFTVPTTRFITIWMSDGTSPFGLLTADNAGDICYGSTAGIYIAQAAGGTTWLL